jgi:hypothetical protein
MFVSSVCTTLRPKGELCGRNVKFRILSINFEEKKRGGGGGRRGERNRMVHDDANAESSKAAFGNISERER